MKQQN